MVDAAQWEDRRLWDDREMDTRNSCQSFGSMLSDLIKVTLLTRNDVRTSGGSALMISSLRDSGNEP